MALRPVSGTEVMGPGRYTRIPGNSSFLLIPNRDLVTALGLAHIRKGGALVKPLSTNSLSHMCLPAPLRMFRPLVPLSHATGLFDEFCCHSTKWALSVARCIFVTQSSRLSKVSSCPASGSISPESAPYATLAKQLYWDWTYIHGPSNSCWHNPPCHSGYTTTVQAKAHQGRFDHTNTKSSHSARTCFTKTTRF